MFRKIAFHASILLVVIAGGVILFSGCEGGGSDDVIANTEVNFSGNYAGSDDGTESLVKNSGDGSTIIRSLQLIQTGTSLDAVDNNGGVYNGNIQFTVETEASFILEDPATGGNQVTMTGTLAGSGDSATMRGNYITPSQVAYIYGVASITPIITNSPSPDPTNTTVTINPTTATLNTDAATQEFSASGGDGNYTWTIAEGIGSLEEDTGTPVTYRRSGQGTNVLTVTDGQGESAEATIIQP